MKIWLCAALLSLPCLAGCGGSSSPNTAAPLTPRSLSAALPNGLTATLTEDRSTVSVGGTVTYTATLTNSTAQPVTYQPVLSGSGLAGVPAALSVSDPSGQIVYPLGPIAQFVGIGPSVTLAPGQSVSAPQAVTTTRIDGLTVTEGYAAAGKYTASAVFAVVPGSVPDASQGINVTVGPLPVTAQ